VLFRSPTRREILQSLGYDPTRFADGGDVEDTELASPGLTPNVTSSIRYDFPQAPPDALSQPEEFLPAFQESSGLELISDLIGGASRDPARAQRSLATLRALGKGIAAEPGRIWGELSRSGASMTDLDPSGAAYHLAGTVPFLGPAAQQVASDGAGGRYQSGLGHLFGLGTQVALPELVKGIPRLGAAEEAGLRQRIGLPAEPPGLTERVAEAVPAAAGPRAQPVGNILGTLDRAADAALDRLRQRGSFSGTRLQAGIPVDDMKDMAIWGASKLAQGTVNFGDWSKEILAEAGPAAEQIQPLLPGLYEQAKKTLDRHVTNTAGNLPNTQKMLDMYQRGIEGADWYANTKSELESVFGPDTNQFVDFLAATSPNTTVAANTTLALKAYRQWKTGQSFEGYLPKVKDLLNQAAAGEDFGGPKVRSFRKNLHGDPLPVTVDRWMARALGFGDSVTDPQYKFADYLITQVAQKKGIEPRQMQAAIWKTIKDAQGIAGQTGESYQTLLRKKLLSDPDLAATIQKLAPPR
jgi:hypothetical protein